MPLTHDPSSTAGSASKTSADPSTMSSFSRHNAATKESDYSLDAHEMQMRNFTDEELITACFELIDADGGGTLDKSEFQEWFSGSDLNGLMNFMEFYAKGI